MNNVMFSRKSDEWATPQALYDELNAEFDFALDPCATPDNAKDRRFFTKENDGLSHAWSQVASSAFINPPHSQLKKWIAKCHEESLMGVTCVMLIPARTDTKAWGSYIWNYQMHRPRENVEVRFLPGRLKFGGSKNSAPFPSAIIVFHPSRS